MSGDEDDHSAPVARPPFSLALRNSGVFLAVVAGGAVIQYLRGIITPLVIALFLLMLIDGFDRAIAHRMPALPSWLRLTLGAALTVSGFAIVVVICAHDARSFADQIGIIAPKIDALLAEFAAQIQAPAPQVGDLLRVATSAASLTHAFGAARGFISESVLVVIYLGFLLASRQAFGRKLQLMFTGPGGRDHAGRVFTRVRSASEQYVGLQTLKAASASSTARSSLCFCWVFWAAPSSRSRTSSCPSCRATGSISTRSSSCSRSASGARCWASPAPYCRRR